LFNLVGGAWPVVWLRSFEWVYGRKEEDWLQKTYLQDVVCEIGWLLAWARASDVTKTDYELHQPPD
jgi:hypothetical protein